MIIPIERVRDVKGIKQWLGCDTSFKVRGRDYWFCEEIKEARLGICLDKKQYYVLVYELNQTLQF